MLVVSAELLTPAGPAGAAREPLPEKAREAAAIVRLAGDTKRDAAAAVKQVQLKTAAAVLEEPFAPVPESEAVDDTYFEDAVFLGDSRTEGMPLPAEALIPRCCRPMWAVWWTMWIRLWPFTTR